MNIKEIITKMKLFLQENLAEVKTTDGVVITFDGDVLAIDVEVFTINDAGEKLPVPDGEYTLEDGTNIVVMDGKVTELEAPEEVPAEIPEETPAAPAETPAPEAAPVAPMMSIEDLASKVKCLEEDNAQLKDALELLANNLANVNFKKEVKMSMVEEQPKNEVRTSTKAYVSDNNPLNKVFKNMYK